VPALFDLGKDALMRHRWLAS